MSSQFTTDDACGADDAYSSVAPDLNANFGLFKNSILSENKWEIYMVEITLQPLQESVIYWIRSVQLDREKW